MGRGPRRTLGFLALLASTAAACSSVASEPVASTAVAAPAQTGPSTETGEVVVAPDLGGEEFLVQIVLTDQGFHPSVIHIPAGRHVRMVLRNRGSTEHHFRVVGLVPAEMRWMVEPELDLSEIDVLDDEDLAQYGLEANDTTDEDMTHILHHLTPTFVARREESPAGIKPLGTEVHGYATAGDKEVMTFFALNTGRFRAEDVLHPGISGSVVVFVPEESRTSG